MDSLHVLPPSLVMADPMKQNKLSQKPNKISKERMNKIK